MVYSHCSWSRSLSALRRASRSAGELAADIDLANMGETKIAPTSMVRTRTQIRYRMTALHRWISMGGRTATAQMTTVRRVRSQIVIGSVEIGGWGRCAASYPHQA